MSIDWITVVAQMANFLVLVWLLKRFLYKPILNGIDAREAEIALRMGEAGKAKASAESAEHNYRQQAAELKATQAAAVDKALEVSSKERDALLTNAREKLEQEQRDLHDHLAGERERFTSALELASADTMLELTRRALHDLADEQLESCVVRQVSARLQAMTDHLAEAVGDSTEAMATTRHPLSAAAKEQLSAEINKLLPSIELKFETDPKQSPGLVLRAGGAQVAWTIDSYTDEFRALLAERISSDKHDRTLAAGVSQ